MLCLLVYLHLLQLLVVEILLRAAREYLCKEKGRGKGGEGRVEGGGGASRESYRKVIDELGDVRFGGIIRTGGKQLRLDNIHARRV